MLVPELLISVCVSQHGCVLFCREVKRKGSKETKVNEISDPVLLERYVAIADYEKQKKNECSLMAGQTVEVVDKNQNGG